MFSFAVGWHDSRQLVSKLKNLWRDVIHDKPGECKMVTPRKWKTRPVTEWGVQEYDFFLAPFEKPFPPLAVRWCGHELIRPEVPVPTPESYPYAVIKFAITGRGTFSSGGRKFPIREDMVFWTLPGRGSVLSALSGHTLANYALCLFGTDVESLVRRHLGAVAGAVRLHNAYRVRSIFENIIEEAVAGGEDAISDCEHLAHVLVRRVGVNMIGGQHRRNSLTKRTFLRCREHMHRHFSEIHSLLDVARPCGVTLQHLCNLFDKFERLTPHAYLTKLKMTKAENLLIRSGMSIAEISAEVGYSGPRSFSRNFRVFFKMTPTQYRVSRS